MYSNILVPLDLEDPVAIDTGLGQAVSFAVTFGSRLNLMTVVPDFGMSLVAQYVPHDYRQRVMAEARQRLANIKQQYVPEAIDAQILVGHGRVYEEILRNSRDYGCDLIVMLSHRPDLRDYLLGPNAARVVRHASCSVLVVRSKDSEG